MAAEVSQQLGAEKANAPAVETDIAAAKPEATTILNGVGNGSFSPAGYRDPCRSRDDADAVDREYGVTHCGTLLRKQIPPAGMAGGICYGCIRYRIIVTTEKPEIHTRAGNDDSVDGLKRFGM